jgi:hypothetical protein
MSLDMPVIEFSDEVRDLARQIIRVSNEPSIPLAIWAICRSGRSLKAVRMYQALGIDAKLAQFVAENIADECETQAVIKAAGITDDESAIAYMNKVRPILYALNAQVNEIKERCNAEIGNLLSGVTEEFWRSL